MIVAIPLAVGLVLMHGVTDPRTRGLPEPSDHFAATAGPGSSEGEHGVLGHHELEGCVANVPLVAPTVKLLVTISHAPSREDLVVKASKRIIALDLSPPGLAGLRVALC